MIAEDTDVLRLRKNSKVEEKSRDIDRERERAEEAPQTKPTKMKKKKL